MSDQWHLFHIPVDGPFHLYHSEHRIGDQQARNIVRAANPDTTIEIARITVRDRDANVWFSPDPNLEMNLRARKIVADEFGWHMIMYGSVAIAGISEKQIAHYISGYG